MALAGVKNAKLSMNAKVEVKAGTSYEKRTYAGVPLVFRLGSRSSVDTVRITWPNGLMQNEMKQPVNKVLVVKEAPRLAGSCPMIFTWNGRQFQFVTDVLGVAPLGASSGDGQYFPVDHVEYVSIPAAMLEAREGAYEIRMTEELREVSYIDQIKLMALDHPSDTEIVTNEKFKSPPFPEFRLYGGDPPHLSHVGAGCSRSRCAGGPAGARPALPGCVPARPCGRGGTAHAGPEFRGRGPGWQGRAGALRLGGLGRRQHLPGGHRGASRPGVSVSSGQGCAGKLEDRRSRTWACHPASPSRWRWI